MVYNLIKNDFGVKERLNCSEKIFYAANEAYGLGLSKETLKIAAAFGGGMGVATTCGALTGAVMALSAMYVEDIARDDEKVFDLTKELFEKYEAKMGSIICSPLKEEYRDEDLGCYHVILEAAKILDEIVANNPVRYI